MNLLVKDGKVREQVLQRVSILLTKFFLPFVKRLIVFIRKKVVNTPQSLLFFYFR
jgi:hypothetical protein